MNCPEHELSVDGPRCLDFLDSVASTEFDKNLLTVVILSSVLRRGLLQPLLLELLLELLLLLLLKLLLMLLLQSLIAKSGDLPRVRVPVVLIQVARSTCRAVSGRVV